jgi:hypothetical protein
MAVSVKKRVRDNKAFSVGAVYLKIQFITQAHLHNKEQPVNAV